MITDSNRTQVCVNLRLTRESKCDFDPIHSKLMIYSLSRTQRAMCRILWRWSGYTQERVAEMLETTKQQVQFAIANRKNDDDRKDWDFVPEDLRKKYQGEVCQRTIPRTMITDRYRMAASETYI